MTLMMAKLSPAKDIYSRHLLTAISYETLSNSSHTSQIFFIVVSKMDPWKWSHIYSTTLQAFIFLRKTFLEDGVNVKQATGSLKHEPNNITG